MLDLIGSAVIRGLNFIFNFIPIEFSLWLGRRIGWLAFVINKKRRMVAYANLKAAFAKEKSPEELRRLTRRVYENMAQTFMEILCLTKVSKKYTDKYVEVANLERIHNAAKSGRGTILLTAHFGDWELSSLTSSMHGFPILVLAREQKMKRMNELLNELRESKGCKVIRKGMDVKNIIRALRAHELVGILSDQDAGKNGVFVDFFGRPTSCHVGPMELAMRTDSLVLPNFNVRVRGPYHRLCLEEYIDFRNIKSADPVREGLQRFATLLEQYIRRYPDQWLWLHKRWKSTPTRNVIVLSDGKAGHLNQSMGIAEYIREARMTQGYGPGDTTVTVLDVVYKKGWMRVLLSALASLASWRSHGRMWALKLCLTEESYKNLMSSYGEFVVSCGSSLAAVNIFISIENNAKNVVVMKPNIPFGLRRFKLAVIPRHDNPPKRKNVVETIIAPNIVSEAKLSAHGKMVEERLGGKRGSIIAVFIGGDNPEYTLSLKNATEVIETALKFADQFNARLAISTSRRTSKQIERYLKERLGSDRRAALLVIANENNFDEAVLGILSVSDMVLVSEESVSMVSESVTARKKTVVYKIDKKISKETKHERMLASLERERLIKVTTVDGLLVAMKQVWHSPSGPGVIHDEEKIFAAIRKLI